MKTKFMAILAVAGAALVISTAASARSEYYWPTWLRQSEMTGCLNNGQDPMVCGCVLRHAMARIPAAEMIAFERAMGVGNRPRASTLRKIYASAAGC
jgi:hypothetical protein